MIYKREKYIIFAVPLDSHNRSQTRQAWEVTALVKGKKSEAKITAYGYSDDGKPETITAIKIRDSVLFLLNGKIEMDFRYKMEIPMEKGGYVIGGTFITKPHTKLSAYTALEGHYGFMEILKVNGNIGTIPQFFSPDTIY